MINFKKDLEEWESGSLFTRFKKHFIFKEDFNNRLLTDSKQLLDWNRQKDDSSDEEDESDNESSSESESEGESSSDEDN